MLLSYVVHAAGKGGIAHSFSLTVIASVPRSPWGLLKKVGHRVNTPLQRHAHSHHSPLGAALCHAKTIRNEFARREQDIYGPCHHHALRTTRIRTHHPGSPRLGVCPLWSYDDVLTLCPPPPICRYVALSAQVTMLSGLQARPACRGGDGTGFAFGLRHIMKAGR